MQFNRKIINANKKKDVCTCYKMRKIIFNTGPEWAKAKLVFRKRNVNCNKREKCSKKIKTNNIDNIKNLCPNADEKILLKH